MESNAAASRANIIYPFSMSIDPSSDNPSQPLSVVTSSGQSQISCPIGTNVKILGAFYKLNDPYGECTSNVSSILQSECACASGGTCPSATCDGSGDNNRVCSNLNTTFNNTVCTNADNFCAYARDASAVLASQCDGKQSCNAILNNTFFGPNPCGSNVPISTTSCDAECDSSTNQYCNLPYTLGYNGEPPTGGSTGGQANYNLGYSISGVYTCVPINE